MKRTLVALLTLLLLCGGVLAQSDPSPPANVTAKDRPHDRGEVVVIRWDPSPSDGTLEGFAGYQILRRIGPDGKWLPITKYVKGKAQVPPGTSEWMDRRAPTDVEVRYRVVALAGETRSAPAETAEAAVATKDLFEMGRYSNFLAIWLFTGILLGWIWAAARKLPGPAALVFFLLTLLFTIMMLSDGMGAGHALAPFIAPAIAVALPLLKRGSEIYVRPIPALQAVEDAIGRATEMGKPILFVPGISSISDVATIAALNILSPVAEKSARYDSRLIVPNYDPVVYTIAQEVVKEAYTKAGRPDAYRDEDVFFLTARQFAYAAAVSGIMMREKPATNFFLGLFFAESLLLAETGNMTGAIQIAGTDAVTQLPFFIVACDYTLIGEELYAAGAYMGDDPKLTGSLKGQDWNKALVIVIFILFALGALVYSVIEKPSDWDESVRRTPESIFAVEQ